MKKSSWNSLKDTKNWIANGMFVNYSNLFMDSNKEEENGMMLSAEFLPT